MSMEARNCRRRARRVERFVVFAFSIVATFFHCAIKMEARAAEYLTTNFVVVAPDYEFARIVGEKAEDFRSELALLWLGVELPPWSDRCSVNVIVGKEEASGGETVFTFSGGHVYGWKMRVQGTRERILDSVLPHEITHTILASYLRAPAPRWLDEGMATSVEAYPERTKYRQLLAKFLHTQRGIPFNDMATMKDYPKDPTPFYSQSFSVCEYLIMIGGRQRLVAFAGEGSITKDWNKALKKYYGCESLGDLQKEWLAWVKKWDDAQRPDVLPATRSMPEFVFDHETLAQNDRDSKPSVLNLFRGRSAENRPDVVTRGQNPAKKQGGFLSGLFGGEKEEIGVPTGRDSRASSVVADKGVNPLSDGAGSAVRTPRYYQNNTGEYVPGVRPLYNSTPYRVER